MIVISIKETDKKDHSRHAHNLLRECLKAYRIDYCVGKTAIKKGSHGKPSLCEHPEIKYNLSHADSIAVCLVTDTECGVDCERVRPYRPNVLRRSFSDSEKALIENTPDDRKDITFFRIWTLKESYVKAIGTGISYPLETVEFSFEGDRIISNVKGFSFRQYVLKGGKFVVAVCKKNKGDDKNE